MGRTPPIGFGMPPSYIDGCVGGRTGGNRGRACIECSRFGRLEIVATCAAMLAVGVSEYHPAPSAATKQATTAPGDAGEVDQRRRDHGELPGRPPAAGHSVRGRCPVLARRRLGRALLRRRVPGEGPRDRRRVRLVPAQHAARELRPPVHYRLAQRAAGGPSRGPAPTSRSTRTRWWSSRRTRSATSPGEPYGNTWIVNSNDVRTATVVLGSSADIEPAFASWCHDEHGPVAIGTGGWTGPATTTTATRSMRWAARPCHCPRQRAPVADLGHSPRWSWASDLQHATDRSGVRAAERKRSRSAR